MGIVCALIISQMKTKPRTKCATKINAEMHTPIMVHRKSKHACVRACLDAYKVRITSHSHRDFIEIVKYHTYGRIIRIFLFFICDFRKSKHEFHHTKEIAVYLIRLRDEVVANVKNETKGMSKTEKRNISSWKFCSFDRWHSTEKSRLNRSRIVSKSFGTKHSTAHSIVLYFNQFCLLPLPPPLSSSLTLFYCCLSSVVFEHWLHSQYISVKLNSCRWSHTHTCTHALSLFALYVCMFSGHMLSSKSGVRTRTTHTRTLVLYAHVNISK